MASTSKTATLKLNQWVASDPVLREDFNADNTKLDAAIHALSLVFLKRGALTANAPKLNVDLSSLDLTQYQALRLVVNPISSVEATTNLGLTMNNLSSVDGTYIQSAFVNGTFYDSKSLSALGAMPDGGTVITVDISLTNRLPGTISCRGDYLGASFLFFYVNAAYLSKSNLANLQIFSAGSNPLKAGSKYTLYGLKG